MCPNPSSVTITPDGTHVYVACENDVRVIDVATNQVVGPPIPVELRTGARSPRTARRCSLPTRKAPCRSIDTATNQAGAPIPSAESPQSVAITPDGTRAYVPDYTDKRIFVIDTATRQVIGSPIADFRRTRIHRRQPGRQEGRSPSMFNAGAITGVDTTTNQLIGPRYPPAKASAGSRIVPDQSPARLLRAAGESPPRCSRHPERRRLHRPRRHGCHLRLELRRRHRRKRAGADHNSHLRQTGHLPGDP